MFLNSEWSLVFWMSGRPRQAGLQPTTSHRFCTSICYSAIEGQSHTSVLDILQNRGVGESSLTAALCVCVSVCVRLFCFSTGGGASCLEDALQRRVFGEQEVAVKVFRWRYIVTACKCNWILLRCPMPAFGGLLGRAPRGLQACKLMFTCQESAVVRLYLW